MGVAGESGGSSNPGSGSGRCGPIADGVACVWNLRPRFAPRSVQLLLNHLVDHVRDVAPLGLQKGKSVAQEEEAVEVRHQRGD